MAHQVSVGYVGMSNSESVNYRVVLFMIGDVIAEFALSALWSAFSFPGSWDTYVL